MALLEHLLRRHMKAGDLVSVCWNDETGDVTSRLSTGSGTIVSTRNCDIGFYRVLFQGEVRTFHRDYLDVINEYSDSFTDAMLETVACGVDHKAFETRLRPDEEVIC